MEVLFFRPARIFPRNLVRNRCFSGDCGCYGSNDASCTPLAHVSSIKQGIGVKFRGMEGLMSLFAGFETITKTSRRFYMTSTESANALICRPLWIGTAPGAHLMLTLGICGRMKAFGSSAGVDIGSSGAALCEKFSRVVRFGREFRTNMATNGPQTYPDSNEIPSSPFYDI